jgi:acetate---CoA ligase (ADP-forming)
MHADMTVIDAPDGYPDGWQFDTVLKDGKTVRVRPIVESDGDGLQALVRGMSNESAYHRFFRVKHELSRSELEYFTVVDYADRMAFVAIASGELIGVGRYDRQSEGTVAEVAFAVAEGHQGRGVASQLIQHLTNYARTQDIDQFSAYVLADNHSMMRVFRNAGFQMERSFEAGVYTVKFPTEESPERWEIETQRERRAVAASMMPIFYPHAVAVIGASRNPASIGGRLFRNLLKGEFTGPVFPINPSATVVRSVKAYKSVLDVPDPIDLAFICVPAKLVLGVVEECAEKGVKGIVVITAGFGETGEAGRALEQQVLNIVRSNGMRMVGPNCMGILNTDPVVSIDGQFGPITPPRGNVAMSSQSGALGIAILDYAKRLNIGISSFVSVGNKADVSGNDLLLFWEDDPSTDVILLYLESFGNPHRFSRLARRIAKKKPIVVVKSGRSAAGARAASSHTGSLASSDTAVDALFRQAGVIRIDTLESMFDVTSLLANQPLPKGRRVGVLTNAGGPAILAVDALEARGLDVVEFSDALKESLRAILSPDASVTNPVDMIASAGPSQYAACLSLMLDSSEIDSVLVIFIPASPDGVVDTAEAIRGAADAYHGDKTVLAVYMSSAGAPDELSAGTNKIPTYPFPEPAARALSKAVGYAEWREKDHGHVVDFDDVDKGAARMIVEAAVARSNEEEGIWLEPAEVAGILAAYGIAQPVSEVVATPDEAVAIWSSVGGPVVLKVVAPSALHKSDMGGVALDLGSEDEVRAAFGKVTSVVDDAEGVLVQEFVAGGHEVLIGMTDDPNFGPLIVFGLGGVFVELIGDVSFRIHPITTIEADDMIHEVKSARLLEGYRGGDPGDIPAVQETLLRVSALVEDLPEVAEMDLNPVKVKLPGSGVSVVDARIRVRSIDDRWVPNRRDVPSEI